MKCCSMLLANVTFMGYFKVLFFPNRQHFDGFFFDVGERNVYTVYT